MKVINITSIPVTVLTVALNSENIIARAIESVMSQTYDNIEYIVLDGASSDNTAAIAESYVEKFNTHKGRSMRVISEPDRGMYDALNKGARLAHGTIIGQVNADDWYEPDAVKTMAELYEHERYNVGWGTVRLITGKGNMLKHAKLPARKAFHLWTTSGWHHTTQFTERETLLQHPYICENFDDDFEFITWCYVNNKKFAVADEVITNFSFGGVSTKGTFGQAMHRLHCAMKIYRKYGFSRLYWLQRFVYETAKYIMS